MGLDVYINFNGNCREAVDFYSKVFNVPKNQIMTFGEMPHDPNFPMPESSKNLIAHTYLNIYDSMTMFSDTFPGYPLTVGNNMSLIITTNNIDEIKSLYNKLKEGGSVEMELQETFWSKCYGSVKDKFGINWQFSHEK